MSPPRGLKAILAKAPSDVVILSALRTPICRSYKGRLKDAYPEELLASVLRATLTSLPELAPSRVEDVAVGVVLSELGGSKAARMALNHAGFPNETSLFTVNRACASSLQGIAVLGAQIRGGALGAGIGAGMESMTRNYGTRAVPVDLWPALRAERGAEGRDVSDCVMPMGLTAERVARRFGVSRGDQDAFARVSHERAAAARDAGLFAAETVPVTTRFREAVVDNNNNNNNSNDDEGGVREVEITVTQDDGIRDGVTAEALARLKPAFAPDGTATAGNSSQVSDGAAAVLLMRRSLAHTLGLEGRIMGKFVAATTVGCAPSLMGIGPALAVPKLLGQLGLAVSDVHAWELNEAFASQAVHCLRALGLEDAWARGRVNGRGGAIALGHPLGATGARMVSTLMHGMEEEGGGRVGVVSMCVGTGMGMAGCFVSEAQA